MMVAPLARTLALSAMLVMGGAMAPLQAQAQAPAVPEAGQPATPDQARLESFVEASMKVEKITVEAQQQMDQAKSVEELEPLREQTRVQAIEALRSEGFTVEDYTALYELAQRDPQIGQAVQAIVEEKRGG